MEPDDSPRPVFLAPLPLPPSLSQLLYAADLPPTPTGKLNNQKPIRKPRSTPAPTLFYPRPPHLVPCPGCLLGAPDLPTNIRDTQRGLPYSTCDVPHLFPSSPPCSNLQSPHFPMYGQGLPLLKN